MVLQYYLANMGRDVPEITPIGGFRRLETLLTGENNDLQLNLCIVCQF
jgi:hypothetical protein